MAEWLWSLLKLIFSDSASLTVWGQFFRVFPKKGFVTPRITGHWTGTWVNSRNSLSWMVKYGRLSPQKASGDIKLSSDWTMWEQSVGDEAIITIGSAQITSSHIKWRCDKTLKRLLNMSSSCTEAKTLGGGGGLTRAWCILATSSIFSSPLLSGESRSCSSGLLFSISLGGLKEGVAWLFAPGIKVWYTVPNRCKFNVSPASRRGQWQILSHTDSRQDIPLLKKVGATCEVNS